MVEKITFLGKKQKFCFVRWTAGEDERDYLVRVEKLSRGVDLGTTDGARRRLCLALTGSSHNERVTLHIQYKAT